jgi:translation initiation factor SUI1
MEIQPVTIQVQKRSGTKYLTSIVGLANDLDLEKIMAYLKHKYKCNGFISNDPKNGEVITLTGDQKENVYKFLISEQIYKKTEILTRGI